MDINSTVNKLVSPIEKNATLIGAGLSGLRFYPGMVDSITKLVSGQGHAPNIQNMINDAMTVPEVKTAAMALVAGYVLKDATGNSTITKLASAAQKGATGYLAVYAAANILYFITHAGEGCQNSGFTKPQETPTSSPIMNRGYN